MIFSATTSESRRRERQILPVAPLPVSGSKKLIRAGGQRLPAGSRDAYLHRNGQGRRLERAGALELLHQKPFASRVRGCDGVSLKRPPIKTATRGTAPTHRQGSTSDPESEEVTLPSPKNLTADISFSTRCSDMVKASRCNRAVCIQSSASPPRKLARARGLCQGALKIQLRHLTCSS